MAVKRLGKQQAEVAELRLHGQFSEDQIIECREVGSDSTIEIRDKVHQVFLTLPDPLLSVNDLVELLQLPNRLREIQDALDQLVSASDLECDEDSTRPLFRDRSGSNEVLYRLRPGEFRPLKIVGLETEIRPKEEGSESVRYYQFSCDGRLIRQIANIERFDAVTGEGAQREEIKKHIESIAQGMSQGVQVPNSILLVFDPERTLHASDMEADDPDAEEEALSSGLGFIRRDDSSLYEYPNPFNDTLSPVQRISPVEIVIPFRRSAFNHEKVLMIADGQQRTAALAITSIDDVPEYMLTVNAVLAPSKNAAQEIFAVANQTRPIKADFSTLIRAIAAGNPRPDQYSAVVARRLSVEGDSPFVGLVELPGQKVTKSRAPVAFMSLESAVSRIYEAAKRVDPNLQLEDLYQISRRFFLSVKATWPGAWGLKPQVSKLMHGVGIKAIASWFASQLVLEATDRNALNSGAFWDVINGKLRFMENYCVRWTKVDADAGSRLHQQFFQTEIQPRGNTFQDIAKLSRSLDAAAVGKA